MRRIRRRRTVPNKSVLRRAAENETTGCSDGRLKKHRSKRQSIWYTTHMAKSIGTIRWSGGLISMSVMRKAGYKDEVWGAWIDLIPCKTQHRMYRWLKWKHRGKHQILWCSRWRQRRTNHIFNWRFQRCFGLEDHALDSIHHYWINHYINRCIRSVIEKGD